MQGSKVTTVSPSSLPGIQKYTASIHGGFIVMQTSLHLSVSGTKRMGRTGFWGGHLCFLAWIFYGQRPKGTSTHPSPYGEPEFRHESLSNNSVYWSSSEICQLAFHKVTTKTRGKNWSTNKASLSMFIQKLTQQCYTQGSVHSTGLIIPQVSIDSLPDKHT